MEDQEKQPVPEPPPLHEGQGFWCLVANVKRKRLRAGMEGKGGEVVTVGTKVFPPGRKVYVAKPMWGDGWQTPLVLGKDRSGKWVRIVTKRKYLENFRAQYEYSPTVRQHLITNRRNYEPGDLFAYFIFEDKTDAQSWANNGNARDEKINVERIIKAYDPEYECQIY